MSFRKRLTMFIVLCTVTGCVLTATAAVPTTTAAQAAGTIQGCPSGYVCLYPNASWNNGHPSQIWYTYGAHNLSNQFGVKRIFNNQTDGAIARTCTGFNGVGCGDALPVMVYRDENFTPINSVVLAAH